MDLWKKGSLFKQNKSDAEFLAEQASVRGTLIKKLSRSIKEVQLLFATQEGGGAIGDSRSALGLCARFEDVLRHGLRAKWFSQGSSSNFWPVILKISRKQAITYINSLQYAQTENGKCRAWVRLAVNECSLESYIHVLCQDGSLLGQYYEPHGFLRDDESVSTLTQLLVGVAEVTFDLTVNTASLEFGDAPEAYQPTPLKLKIPVTAGNQTSKDGRTKPSKDQRAKTEHLSKAQEPLKSEHPPLRSANQPLKSEPVSSSDYKDVPSSATPTTDQIEEQSSSLSSDASFTHSTAQLKPGMALVQYSPSVSPGESVSEANSRIERLEQKYGNGSVAVEKSVSPNPDLGVFQDFDAYMYMQNDESSPKTTKESDGGLCNEDNCELETESKQAGKRDIAKASSDEEAIVLDSQAPSVLLTNHLTSSSGPVPNKPFPDEPIPEPPPPQSISPPRTDTLPPLDRSSTNPFLPQFPSEEPHIAISVKQSNSSTNPFSGLEDDSNVETPVSPSNPFLPQNPFQLDSNEADGEATFTRLQVEAATTVKPPSEDLICTDEGCMLPPAGRSKLRTSPDIHKRSSNPFTSPSPPPPVKEEEGEEEETTTDDPPNLFDHFPNLLRRDHLSPPSSFSSSPYHHHDDTSNQTTPSSATPSDTKTTTTPSEYDISSLDLSMALENAFDLSRRLSNLKSAQLQPKEDHFGTELSVRDLEGAIADLKLRLSSSSSSASSSSAEGGGVKHELRKKIVLLQMALYRMKEEEERRASSDQEVLGHRFTRQPLQIRLTGSTMCEGCGRRVRGISRSWYLCQNCQCACHEKCLARVTRVCVASKEDKDYIFAVCPEKGLTTQYFRCASCNQAFNDQATKTRLCDYSGLYYCPSCHRNDEAIIPARVVHNWDFVPRKVCCRCSDLLSRLHSRPLVRIQTLNPLLYTYVQDLVTVESVCQDLLHMKKYFVQCRRAKETQLLQKLDRFPHFKEDNKTFSLQDLVGVYDNKLLPELNEIYAEFAHHIRKDCPLCAGKGFFCELCSTEDIIYPFDRHVRICPHCNSVYHKACYAEMVVCPKCQRAQTKKKIRPRTNN